MPRVSVIIPNYNHSAYLTQRIESVLNQTFQNFEVIILDDFSTDNSKDIIEQYRNHPKISAVVYNHKNSGSTFLQWKKGIELARGEWIWIAESDDWCEATLLNELICGINNQPDCTLSYCQSILFSDYENITSISSNRLGKCMDGKTFVIDNMLHNNNIVNASMCIFKRSAYYNVSQEFTKYRFMGDCLFWIEIALRGKVYISSKALNYFRRHDNNVSSSAYNTGLYYSEYLKLLQYIDLKHGVVGNRISLLLLERFKMFLMDTKISTIYRKKIHLTYKTYLGINYYLEVLRFYKRLIKYNVISFCNNKPI